MIESNDKKLKNTTPFIEGYNSYITHKRNPYPEFSDNYEEWERGNIAAEIDECDFYYNFYDDYFSEYH